MRYLSAYLLSLMGGNEAPAVDDISKILSSVGVDCDKALAKKVVDELSGKNVQDLIAAGKEKMASVPAGGAVVASAGAAETKAAEPAKEAKKEEKKEESEDEDDGDMGFGLFD